MTKDSNLNMLDDLPPTDDHLVSLSNLNMFKHQGQDSIKLGVAESQSGLKIKTEMGSEVTLDNQEQGNQRKLQCISERPVSKLQSRSPSSGVENQSQKSIKLGDKYLTNQTEEGSQSEGSDQILFSDYCYDKIDQKMQNLKVQPKKNWESRNGQIQ